MEANGNFAYQLDFEFNQNKPNALIFDSNIKGEPKNNEIWYSEFNQAQR
jgi:hypothetical protein